MSEKKIRVLVVDDSAIIRKLFESILSQDPQIEVVGSAPDPYVARNKLVQLQPDVMTLDIEMPKMDGITFLDKVMKHFPVRTLVISSLSQKGSETAMQAFETGAISVTEKPNLEEKSQEEVAQELTEKVKAVAQAKLKSKEKVAHMKQNVSKVSRSNEAMTQTTHQVIALAASTGGTEALKVLLPALPADIPGMVIVQHMPPGYTQIFAQSLNRLCSFEVAEAQGGESLVPGKVLLAPGNYHIEIERRGGFYQTTLHQKPPIHGVRPAADYLMDAVSRQAGANAIGLILTGMGHDGASGLLKMKEQGARTLAQDEASCVVFGMPKEAYDKGGVDRLVPLENLPSQLIHEIDKRSSKRDTNAK